MTSAAMAINRIGVNRASGEVSTMASRNLLAEIATMIMSNGTPVESTQARTSRSTTPGRLKCSGTPSRSAATATGRSTRSDCR